MRRLVERLARIQTWITFGVISLITACVATQVFVRYVLQRPLFLWSEEVARFLLIWMVFLGIGVGVKNDAHFAMDVLQAYSGEAIGRGRPIVQRSLHGCSLSSTGAGRSPLRLVRGLPDQSEPGDPDGLGARLHPDRRPRGTALSSGAGSAALE